MTFMLWFLLFEDVLMVAVLSVVLSSRRRMYTLTVFITFLVLIVTNVLLFQRHTSWSLLLLPPVVGTILLLLARPFVSPSSRIMDTRKFNVLLISLTVLILFFIMLSGILVFRLFP
jgi:hypothetical protein